MDSGNLKRTGRERMPGAAEVARRLTTIAREMGIDPEGEVSTQTVFNWRERGISQRLLPAVAKMMKISPEEYLRLSRAPPPGQQSAQKRHSALESN